MRISSTPIALCDEQFLFSLYSKTREEELSLLPWDDEQKKIFLQHQFQAQQTHYVSKYKEQARFQIVRLDRLPVGRLYIAELADEIRIVDIIISPEHRGKKIGTTLLEGILREADEKCKCVQIYLEINDRSANLFARLGFAPFADEGIHQLWRRPANSRANSADA